MSSRKSSASFARSNNVDGASGCDLLVFQGNRVLRPERQPTLPPAAVERQQDEGFAKFLKKHTSPTHNRVTAGGRIVPMEPRSPPPFSLPPNLTKRIQAQSSDRELKNLMREDKADSFNSPSQDRQAFSKSSVNGAAPEQRPSQLYIDTRLNGEFGTNPTPLYYVNDGVQGACEMQSNMNSFPVPTSMASPVRGMFAAQPVGGPVMQTPMHTQQYTMPSYLDSGSVNLGFGVSLTDQYNNPNSWPTYNQGFSQQMPMQQVMPPIQLLAAWEQHYYELDQQLKNIDRHRAMHNLDPNLAVQRRVIVQQRSDAKDTIREYQTMLGLRRLQDSSQDSWNTSFNVEAPAYIPKPELDFTPRLAEKASFNGGHSGPLIEKPPSGQRRIIPIVAPPEEGNGSKPSLRIQTQSMPIRKSSRIEEWTTQSQSTPAEVRRQYGEQAVTADQMQRRGLSHEMSNLSSSQHSMPSSQGIFCTDSAISGSSDDHQLGSASIADARQVEGQRLPTRQEEQEAMLRALAQPENVITKVRLDDGRVIDIQGVGRKERPQSFSSEETRNSAWPASISPQASVGFTGKENISVAPHGHQKAATDAFLTQFNAVEDNMSFSMMPETQSLRTASNGRTAASERGISAYHQEESFRQASKDYLRGSSEKVAVHDNVNAHVVSENDFGLSPESLNNKGYSLVSVQNVHALGSLPNNFDGAVEGRQSVRAQLAAASKSRSPRSPRFLRRLGGNGGAWYGPYCRDIAERSQAQNNNGRSARPFYN